MKPTAQIFKALSDETRLRILALLMDGELCVCDLMAVLKLPQSTVSRHLAYLKNSGLVADRRQGVWMHYRLVDGAGAPHRDILVAVRQRLAELDEAARDRRQLTRYMTKKPAAKPGSCC